MFGKYTCIIFKHSKLKVSELKKPGKMLDKVKIISHNETGVYKVPSSGYHVFGSVPNFLPISRSDRKSIVRMGESSDVYQKDLKKQKLTLKKNSV